MNDSAAVLAITFCLEAQQHTATWQNNFCFGLFPQAYHLSTPFPLHFSPCLLYLEVHASTVQHQ